MKLQQLTIHNIASIEDATIDFEAEPLASSEVFLITGKTGAGKSTILDAICLALFADTPRLRGTLMQGETPDGTDEVTIKDTRQMMRRNTGEAFVTLTFTGSNDVHYEAFWGVARARKKPTGRLQDKTWQLKNLDTGKSFNKVGEITHEIRTAIGLDFNQFCRTTMLAQGEFTRFLNSKDEEKAAILEKITGVDIYAKLGKKVFELTGSKEQAWREIQTQVEGIQTLSDEEVAVRQTAMAEAEAQHHTAKEALDALKTKHLWIKTEGDLTKAVATRTAEYQQAQETQASEEFKSQELTATQWNATIDARAWLAAMRGAEEAQRRLQKALAALETEYATVAGGYAYAEQERQHLQEELKNTLSAIDNEKEQAAVYGKVQTIAGYLTALADGRSRIASSHKAIEQETKQLTEVLLPAMDKAQEAVKEAQTTHDNQAAAIKTQEQLLAQLHLPELRQQRDKGREMMQNIATAQDRLEALATEQKPRQQASDPLQKLIADGKALREKVALMEPQIHDAKVKMDTCKEVLDKQSDTINKFAKTLRQKLKMGDTCPVCRQTIAHPLPHEEELATLVGGLKEAYDQAEAAYRKLADEKTRMEAEMKAVEQSYRTAKEAFDKDTNVETAAARLAAACKACGIDNPDDYTAERLSQLNIQTSEALKDLEESIAHGEAQDAAIKQQHKTLEQLRTALERQKESALKTQQAIADSRSRIATQEELIKSKGSEVAQAEEQTAATISGQWPIDWKSQPKAFMEALQKQADAYEALVKRSQTLENSLSEASNNCRLVLEVLQETLLLMPSWQRPVAPAKQPNLLKRANDIKSRTATALVQLKEAQTSIAQNGKQIADFLAEHGEITAERLTTLGSYTQEQIAALNAAVEEVRNNVLSKKTLLDESTKQLEQHRNNKPPIQENESIEALEAAIAEQEKSLVLMAEKKGAIGQELKADEENKARIGKLVEEATQRKAEYQKWSRLNQLIGDATGNKFRKIAQSYVLSSLIHSANSYMKTLTDRYTLKVLPGTFVITLEDAWQGYVNRAASTLSGGESFLVSLSLSLALSDIGQQLSVDTLFIDEGFGTLSGEPLQNAVNTLRSLHTTSGRHVGIISHVEELRERIPVQIQVQQQGNNSSSKVEVVG